MAGTSPAMTRAKTWVAGQHPPRHGRHIGVRKHAVLWTAMPGHDALPSLFVMPALVAGIHVFLRLSKTWMAGPSPAMTSSQHSSKTDVDGRDEPGHDESKDVGGRTAPSASWPAHRRAKARRPLDGYARP